jgi:hypothetical protein
MSEQDLAAIIQKLIEFLGNANSFIIGAAYNEVCITNFELLLKELTMKASIDTNGPR